MASKKAESKKLKLAAVLDFNEASELRGKLLSMRGAALEIDASQVERVGAQCMQVLMAGAKAWEEDKQSFVFAGSSEAFVKTSQLIGINIEQLLAKENRQ